MIKLKQLWQKSSVLLCITTLLIPTLGQTHKLWQFGGNLLVGPLNVDVFTDSFAIFKSYRPVFNPHLGWILSCFYTYLAPFLLIIGFLLFRTTISGRGKSVVALFVTALCIPIALPGNKSLEIATYLGSLLLIIAQISSGVGITLWFLMFVGLIISFLNSQIALLVFWSISSILFSELLHFFLVERMQIQWRSRSSIGQSTFQIIAWGLLTFSSLILAAMAVPEKIETSSSSFAWAAWIVVLLSVALTWIDPWKSRIWLRATIFPWILYFTPLAEKAVLILIIVLSVKLIQKIFQNHESVWKWSRIPLVAATMIYLCIFVLKYKTPDRSFDLDWIKVPVEISKYSPQNLLVLSNGIPYFSQTSHAKMVLDPHTILMTNEKDLLGWMKENEVDHIIVEKSYFLSFWKEWLEKKMPVEVSNKSVISRIIWYKGEAVSTATLKTPAIESLKLIELETTNKFVVITTKTEAPPKT